MLILFARTKGARDKKPRKRRNGAGGAKVKKINKKKKKVRYGATSKDNALVHKYGKENFVNPRRKKLLVAKKVLPGYEETDRTYLYVDDRVKGVPNGSYEIRHAYNKDTRHLIRIGSMSRKMSGPEAFVRSIDGSGHWIAPG